MNETKRFSTCFSFTPGDRFKESWPVEEEEEEGKETRLLECFPFIGEMQERLTAES